MNIEEAIEFMEGVLDITGSEAEINFIINLLKRGEKFEAMWEKFKKERGNRCAFIVAKPYSGAIKDDMEEYEQKYFQKE